MPQKTGRQPAVKRSGATNAALSRREANFHALAENANDGITIVDHRGKRVYTNGIIARLCGYTQAEWDATPHLERVHPDDRTQMDKFRRQPQNSRVFTLRYLKKDGSVLPVEIAGTGTTWYGKPARMYITRDISQRQRAEAAMRESEERMAVFMNAATDDFTLFDAALNFVDLNQAALRTWGLKKADIIGKHILDISPDLKQTGRYGQYREVLRTGQPLYLDHVQTGTGKNKKYRSLRAFKVGNGLGMVSTDITQKKRAEEELRRINRQLEDAMTQLKTSQAQLLQSGKMAAIGELVSGIAHELNNPLAAISLHAELLADEDDWAEVKNCARTIKEQTDRAVNIVHNLLSFARKHEPKNEVICLNDSLSATLELRRYELNHGNIEIVTELAPDLPLILADNHQLQQVFFNLLTNAEQAIHSVRRQGRISITTRPAGANVRLSLEDNGPGIPADVQARLFEPFFTTKEVGQGTGLGLSICYGIIAEHGGRIFVESDPGHGTAFIIELPVYQDRKSASKREIAAAPRN